MVFVINDLQEVGMDDRAGTGEPDLAWHWERPRPDTPLAHRTIHTHTLTAAISFPAPLVYKIWMKFDTDLLDKDQLARCNCVLDIFCDCVSVWWWEDVVSQLVIIRWFLPPKKSQWADMSGYYQLNFII